MRIFKKLIDPKKEILSEIKQLNFDDVENIVKLIKPTAILDIENGIPKIGSSKFGGCPDLYNSSKWPVFDNKPMVFLCQISTKELSKVDCGFIFKKDGLISVFHHFDNPESEYGAIYDYSPSRHMYKIVFNETTNELQRLSYPDNYVKDYEFEEKAIVFKQSYQIPGSPEHIAVINSKLNESDKNKLYDYAERFMNIFESQIGGYPLPVQAGPELDWTSSKFPNLKYLSSEFVFKALEFENLLSFTFQFDFESIGDSNMYIGITKEDLEKLNFDEAIIIHQAT
ncbi:MAG: DUF1963 domain-containing protein [Fluviicola sp.]